MLSSVDSIRSHHIGTETETCMAPIRASTRPSGLREVSLPASMSWYISATVPCDASNSLIRLPSLAFPTRLLYTDMSSNPARALPRSPQGKAFHQTVDSRCSRGSAESSSMHHQHIDAARSNTLSAPDLAQPAHAHRETFGLIRPNILQRVGTSRPTHVSSHTHLVMKPGER